MDNDFIPQAQMPARASGDNDFIPEGQMPSTQPESWGTEALNTVKDVAGTAGRAVGYGIGDMINAPMQASDYLNRKLAGLFGANPNAIPRPYQFDPGIFPLRQGTEDTLDPLARGIATGVELLQPAKDILMAGLMAGKAGLGALTGLNANAKATEFIKNLRGDQPAIKKGFNSDYTDIDNLADKKGYNLKPNSTQKPIDSTTFNGGFNTMSPNDRESVLNNLSADAKKSMDQFTNKPSYENAHDLQSILGNEGISLRKSADGRDRYVGGQILGLRNNLNSDINDTFDKFGDTDLSNARKDVTQRYADNENRLLLANKLRAGIKELPRGGLNAHAQQIVNAFGKLAFKNSISKFPSPQTAQFEPGIAALQSALSKRDITTKLAKRIGKPLMWGGLAGLGLEGIHRYL
jgi:hypothetical protein